MYVSSAIPRAVVKSRKCFKADSDVSEQFGRPIGLDAALLCARLAEPEPRARTRRAHRLAHTEIRGLGDAQRHGEMWRAPCDHLAVSLWVHGHLLRTPACWRRHTRSRANGRASMECCCFGGHAQGNSPWWLGMGASSCLVLTNRWPLNGAVLELNCFAAQSHVRQGNLAQHPCISLHASIPTACSPPG